MDTSIVAVEISGQLDFVAESFAKVIVTGETIQRLGEDHFGADQLAKAAATVTRAKAEMTNLEVLSEIVGSGAVAAGEGVDRVQALLDDGVIKQGQLEMLDQARRAGDSEFFDQIAGNLRRTAAANVTAIEEMADDIEDQYLAGSGLHEDQA